MPPPTERLPRGGYLVAATIERASAASITIGRDDSHRAAVEHHLDELVFAGGDASQRNTAGVGDRAEHERGGLDVGVSVLHVDSQPGKSGPGHEPRCRNAAEREPGADLRLAGLERPFDWIFFQVTSSTKFRMSSRRGLEGGNSHHETSFSLQPRGSKSGPVSISPQGRARQGSSTHVFTGCCLACDDKVELVRMFGNYAAWIARPSPPRLDPIHARHTRHGNVFSAGQRRIKDDAASWLDTWANRATRFS